MVKIKIFDISYLCNSALTDEDLHYIFDTPSLIYSFIFSEIKLVKPKFSQQDLTKFMGRCTKNDLWLSQYKLTKQQFLNFENTICKAYKNIYYYSDEQCKSLAQWFMIRYGFDTKQKKK